MAGTITKTSDDATISWGYERTRKVRKIVIDFTADAADGSVPALSLTNLHGYVLKVVTNPGSTAPTDNWDIVLNSDSDTSLDHFAGTLLNRDTANTEAVYPLVSGAACPIWLEPKTYSLAISGNSVNSATGQITIYLVSDF
jgi:hypothetical protein